MDPQSQSFTPYGNSETWRLQNDVVRVQQVQAEHSERIARLERRQDEDARVKSVWGNQSPFPSVLSGGAGGTPNQGPLNQPPSDQFQGFDDEANTLMNSLPNLDAEDEPRRGLGAASRANSVRFDETANQNFTHSSRPSMEFLSRSSSGGLGGLQMNERSSSHKSEGRASSAHSMRSAASGRANSLNMDTTYGMSDSRSSLPEPPPIAPGMMLMGSVPAIIRCWMNMNFKHDALLYAAVATGSYKSFIDIHLVIKLGYEGIIRPADENGVRTIGLPVYFPEATQQPVAFRVPGTLTTPQLPYLTAEFQLIGDATDENESPIQILLGSDMLRAHSADILFSSNSMTLFDNDRHKLSIPLVRPEDEAAFKSLYIASGTPATSSYKAEPQSRLNGLGQGSSAASVSSGAVSPHPTLNKYRPPGAQAADPSSNDFVKAGAGTGSDSDPRPASRQSNASRPSLNLNTARSEAQDSATQPSESTTSTTPLRSGSSPAIWSNWRREGPSTTPATATPSTAASSMDWASTSRNRDANYQRRETGMKVLKPKAASRTFSTTAAPPSGDGGSSAKGSRFFDDGKRKSEIDPKPVGSAGDGASSKKEGEASSEKKTKPNPIGMGSAFSWMNSSSRRAIATTASAQKRRKVGLFGGDGISSDPATSSPTHSGADSPSPTDSNTTGGATPPPKRFVPPHLHEEVFVSGSGGASPIASLAEVSLEGGSGGDMVGSGREEEQKKVGSPGRGVGVRSASPAKRSASDMEGDDRATQTVPGSFGQESQSAPTDFDQAMAGMTPRQIGDADTQGTADQSMQTSAQDSMTTNTSATSLQSEELPAYSADITSGESTTMKTPTIDEQERIVRQLSSAQLDEGQQGYVVSTKWLARVISRSSEGLKSSAYPKEAREGDIGRIDNSDLVPDGTFSGTLIADANKKTYVPLKPGLTPGEDYELLPEKAWGQILSWYGLAQGQKQIVRYVHNTAPPGAEVTNFMYELYPPIFTIRKVPQSALEENGPKRSLDELRRKQERKDRGQLSPDDAFRLVSSRSEKFQNFLKRAKEAAEIPFSTRVKIWRTAKASHAVAKGNPSGVLSPPHSRSTSPKSEQAPKLIIDAATFNKMEECELIDGKDETSNANYNGSSTMDMYQLFEDATLVLEEQISGPGGGEYASDKKPKHTIKLGLPGRSQGSKAPSAAPSRGNSPAPGGMMTRGRQRRDGRTRGTVGLGNLGNTCYMNSALQCIRSVEELAFYFLSDKWKSEVNSSNPLGHGGAMAKQYAVLLQNIYGENASGSFSPSAFKKTLGSMQPLFSGYGQQDSQEFLSFLVDAIHEDLNRIQKKPYNENPDSDDSTVRDPQAIIKLGETYRANHKARNESIAMDLFNGFYKNTMECPDCGKISITFDPYSLVTVQLPIESTFTHNYVFVPRSGKPVKHDIDLEKNSTIKALKEYVASKHPGVQAERLLMGEVYNHKLYKVFEDTLTLAEAGIGNNDYIFIFELPDVPSNPPVESKKKYSGFSLFNSGSKQDDEVPEMDDPKAEQFAVPIFLRQKARFGNGWEHIMHPTFTVITREEAKNYDTVLKKVLIAVSRLTTLPILTELKDLTKEEDENEDPDSKAENGNSTNEDKEVSDRSASEDGYVEISKHADGASGQTNGISKAKEDRPMPHDFLDPEYVLSTALRNQLFVMKWGKSVEGMYCTGLNNPTSTLNDMADRVKQPTRRGSMDSSTSGDESTTSTASGAQENGEPEIEDSDADFDKPDIVVGKTEDSLSLPTPTEKADESDEDLPSNPLAASKPGGRKGGKKQRRNKKGRSGKNQTYSRKDRQKYKGQSNGNNRFNVGGKSLHKDDEEDNPFYIKLGEGIVLDWYPEALSNVFGGNSNDDDDKRGRFTSSADGRSLDVVADPVIEEKRKQRSLRKKNGVSLGECFTETGKREVLSEDNAWYCGNCKELRRATKTLEIWTIPDILVVHLKRFGGNRSFRDKIDVLVDYPIENLDMTERVGLKEDDKEYIYDLFAVDNHYGGLGGGHYTAYAKNFYDGQWYDYNDASCSKLGDRNLQNNAAAYLLFYRRRSPTPLGPQYLQDLVNEARTPSVSNDAQATEDAVDESDSGEGRLDGRTGSQRSSGGWTGAGAGASNVLAGAAGSGGTSGARLGAGNSLMTRETGMNEGDEGKVFYGPERPPQYGNIGNDSWDFDTIDNGGDAASDNGSTTANVDQDEDGDAYMGNSGILDDSPPDLEPAHSSNPFSTSEIGTMDYQDDHTLYSVGREDDVLHLEDAGFVGGDAQSNSTVEMRSPLGAEDDDLKLD